MSSSVADAVTIADLRERAKSRLPRMAFDYIDGGAEREWTLRENCRAFEDVLFRPRSAVATTTLRSEGDGARHHHRPPLHPRAGGQQPHVLSPRRGSGRRQRPARPAPSTASRRSPAAAWKTCKAATSGTAWYQLYLVGGRDVALGAIARAKAAGFKALIVTIDTPVAGMRERDARNGVKQLVARNLVDDSTPRSDARAPWLAVQLLRRRRAHEFPQHRHQQRTRWDMPTSARRSNSR